MKRLDKFDSQRVRVVATVGVVAAHVEVYQGVESEMKILWVDGVAGLAPIKSILGTGEQFAGMSILPPQNAK